MSEVGRVALVANEPAHGSRFEFGNPIAPAFLCRRAGGMKYTPNGPIWRDYVRWAGPFAWKHISKSHQKFLNV